jgi:hypothetical protein
MTDQNPTHAQTIIGRNTLKGIIRRRVNLHPKADSLPPPDVCFGPNTDKLRCSRKDLFDHLVGASQHGAWDSEAEGLGGPEIDDKLEMSRRLKWQISRPRSA